MEIQVIGSNSPCFIDFVLQLVATFGLECNTTAVIKNKELYELFSQDVELDYRIERGRVAIVKDYPPKNDSHIIFTIGETIQSDFTLVVVEQSALAWHSIKSQIAFINSMNVLFVFLNFLDGGYEETYFKRQLIPKTIKGVIGSKIEAFSLPFSERDFLCWQDTILSNRLCTSKLNRNRKQILKKITTYILSSTSKGVIN